MYAKIYLIRAAALEGLTHKSYNATEIARRRTEILRVKSLRPVSLTALLTQIMIKRH
jgi:hypothetical protein